MEGGKSTKLRYSNSAVFVPKTRETKIVNQARLPFLVPTARAAQKKIKTQNWRDYLSIRVAYFGSECPCLSCKLLAKFSFANYRPGGHVVRNEQNAEDKKKHIFLNLDSLCG